MPPGLRSLIHDITIGQFQLNGTSNKIRILLWFTPFFIHLKSLTIQHEETYTEKRLTSRV